KVILKENGKTVEIEQRHREKFPYLDAYVAILYKLINQLNNTENIDIDVNLVEWGNLGRELLLDNRLDTEKIKGNFNSFNNLGAIAIYYVGLNGYILLEKYKEQKFCYIQLQQTYIINMIRITFHEIHHFFDPFIPREWQTILEDGRSFLIYEKTIKAYNRLGLNEYYANIDAFSRSLIFVNETLKSKDRSFLIERFNEVLIDKIPSYLSNLNNGLKEFLVILESGTINNLLIQNPKAELIIYLWSRFFPQTYYFLGGWKAYEDEKLKTTYIQEIWNQFINELEEKDLNEMVNLLDSFKDVMLGDIDDKDKLINQVDFLFLNYYHKGLELDFFSIL
ncbi:MAG: hypothetical protein ACFFG0_43805, partial [Candidatus Thorarchaeota archaeon]